MFDFFNMLNNYKARCVDRYEADNIIVDTCSVTDSAQPYETGISHPQYNDGKYIIVEMYDTPEQAQKGHNKWVQVMTAKTLPDKLVDISSSTISELRNKMFGTENNTFDRKENDNLKQGRE